MISNSRNRRQFPQNCETTSENLRIFKKTRTLKTFTELYVKYENRLQETLLIFLQTKNYFQGKRSELKKL